LPKSAVPSRLVWLHKVLILAREEVVAALLGLLVELSGFEPFFVGEDESVLEAVRNGRHRIVIIDCDHAECGDSLIEAIREVGATPILFSPFRMEGELRNTASRFGIGSFTLPTDPEKFSQLLQT
jgi:DNA-binding response OmpR family regulator